MMLFRLNSSSFYQVWQTCSLKTFRKTACEFLVQLAWVQISILLRGEWTLDSAISESRLGIVHEQASGAGSISSITTTSRDIKTNRDSTDLLMIFGISMYSTSSSLVSLELASKWVLFSKSSMMPENVQI